MKIFEIGELYKFTCTNGQEIGPFLCLDITQISLSNKKLKFLLMHVKSLGIDWWHQSDIDWVMKITKLSADLEQFKI